MTNHPSANRLRALESALREAKIDLYIVPMVDEFQGEYIPAYAARLPYMTGFTGSAGMGVFWANPSAERRHTLFVDGRYTLQAANEVDSNELVVLNSGDKSFTDWLKDHTGSDLTIGFDPWLVTIEQFERWNRLVENRPVEFKTPANLVDAVWKDQPARPAGEVILHPLEFAGATYTDKRAQMVTAMNTVNADALLLTQCDAINWLLNIRGTDIPFNPLLLSYYLLNKDGSATLYIYEHALSTEVKDYLARENVTVAKLEDLFAGKLAVKGTVLIDHATTPYALAQQMEKLGIKLLAGTDPTQLPKAKKNEAELAGVRDAHVKDGLALTRFLHWMSGQIESKKLFDEVEVVTKLESFRALNPDYRGPSFATIAGTGPHGAIIHYRVDDTSNRRARMGDLFLLDSGGQYPGGTTDVTRTITLGAATTQMKDHFTRVLKGHIALASVQFPVGTTGSQLDVLARQYLWQAGLDFDHGTGHGVGAYLCVHEGPQRISKRGNNVPLETGMIISNEPGYYLPGQYGIRIENLVVVTPGKGDLLAFETLTLVPIDTALVEVSMLTSDERNWLNAYHQRVYQAHGEKMSTEGLRWLARATRAI